MVILGPVRDLPRHGRPRAARLLPAVPLLRALSGPPLLPARQVIRAWRHRGVPAIPRPGTISSLQLLPQVSNHRLQRGDLSACTAISCACSRISASRRSAGGPQAAHRSQQAIIPETTLAPPRQHHVRRWNATHDYSPQHQAQGPECYPARARRLRSLPMINGGDSARNLLSLRCCDAERLRRRVIRSVRIRLLMSMAWSSRQWRRI